MYTVGADGTYTLQVIDAHGCITMSGEVLIGSDSDYHIYIPNAFTPNGDGNNDIVKCYLKNNLGEKFNFMIFNRWGEKVFETSNPAQGWDGTYKGQMQPPGVFVYVVKVVFVPDEGIRDFKGSIALIR